MAQASGPGRPVWKWGDFDTLLGRDAAGDASSPTRDELAREWRPTVDVQERAALASVLPALAAFRVRFRRDPSADFIAELHVAAQLDLRLAPSATEPGFDGWDCQGLRYQIKYRAPGTKQVDLSSFEFDRLVLVSLDKRYQVDGMWVLSVENARPLFTRRPRFRKWQASQARVKAASHRVV